MSLCPLKALFGLLFTFLLVSPETKTPPLCGVDSYSSCSVCLPISKPHHHPRFQPILYPAASHNPHAYLRTHTGVLLPTHNLNSIFFIFHLCFTTAQHVFSHQPLPRPPIVPFLFQLPCLALCCSTTFLPFHEWILPLILDHPVSISS